MLVLCRSPVFFYRTETVTNHLRDWSPQIIANADAINRYTLPPRKAAGAGYEACPPAALQKRDAAGLPHGDAAILPGGQFKVTVDGKGKVGQGKDCPALNRAARVPVNVPNLHAALHRFIVCRVDDDPRAGSPAVSFEKIPYLFQVFFHNAAILGNTAVLVYKKTLKKADDHGKGEIYGNKMRTLRFVILRARLFQKSQRAASA
jgi:hypothetical protein